MAGSAPLLPTSSTTSNVTVELPASPALSAAARHQRSRRVCIGGGTFLTVAALVARAVLHQADTPKSGALIAPAVSANAGAGVTEALLAAQSFSRTILEENWCSATQIDAIKQCNNHCGTCNTRVIDKDLGDCVVVHPFGNTIIAGTAMVFDECRDDNALVASAAADIVRREVVPAGVASALSGSYSYAFGASSFGKPVTLTLNFITADTFSMRVEAPVSSMSKFCPSESYSYTAATGLQVAGYDTVGDCIHDALGVVHANVKGFSYDKGADTIKLTYRLLFRSHTITLSKVN